MIFAAPEAKQTGRGDLLWKFASENLFGDRIIDPALSSASFMPQNFA